MNARFQTKIVKWEVDFNGLLELLGKSLYTHSEVLVRELIQNANDAIVMRRERGEDFASRIDVQISARERTLRVTDNGMGLDATDMERLLSVIAATNKPEFRREVASKGRRAEAEVIGQFGIGFLSVFVAANRVTVDSRKVGADSAYRWSNEGAIESVVSVSEYPEIGTRVELVIKESPEFDYLLDLKSVNAVIVKYMDFLQVPIHLNNQPRTVNTVEAPWDSTESADVDRPKLVDFINRRFGDNPLDIIPVNLPSPTRARGLLYITDDRTPTLQMGGTVQILVRRVCIADNDASFLPDWAKFVCGIIEAPDLSPNAARDGLIRDDAFAGMQEAIGELVIRRLTELAERNPQRFEAIADYHHYHLVGMAVKHDSFFNAVQDLIPFQINVPSNESPDESGEPRMQMLSLRQYCEKATPEQTRGYRKAVYFTAAPGGKNQFNLIAGASGLVIINAPRDFDRSFLQKYVSRRAEELELVQLDESMNDRLFSELSPEEADQIDMLISDIQRGLSKQNLKVVVYARRFRPTSIPAALLSDHITELKVAAAHANRIHGIQNEAEVISRLAGENRDRPPLKLVLNYDSPLVQKVNKLPRDSTVRQEIMLPLYNGSFLASEVFLTSRNTSVLHRDFVNLCQKLVDQHEAASQTRRELSDAMDELRRHAAGRPGMTSPRRHVQLFMMTEYSAMYDMVEAAIRQVFESKPYFFEVRLARDYRAQAVMHESVRAHIEQADGYIAEISGMNHNVLLELGAVLFTHHARPVYCLRNGASEFDVPKDMGHVLRVEYSGSNADEIAEELKVAVAKGIEIETLRKAKSERFLSATVLRTACPHMRWTDVLIKTFQELAPTVERLAEVVPESSAFKVEKMQPAMVRFIIEAVQEYAGPTSVA